MNLLFSLLDRLIAPIADPVWKFIASRAVPADHFDVFEETSP